MNTRKKNISRRKKNISRKKDVQANQVETEVKEFKPKPPSCKNIGSVINHVRLINRLTETIRKKNMKKTKKNTTTNTDVKK